MSAPQAIVWDWNGTLLDDLELSVEIVNGLLDEHRLPPLTPARYRDLFDVPVHLYWERAGLDLARVDFAALSAEFCRRFEAGLDRARVFPDAPRLLAELRRSGKAQLLLSSTEERSLRRMVRAFGLAEAFDAIRGMPDTQARGKAHEGAALLRAAGVDRGRTVLVGDTAHDAEVARALEIECVLIATGHHTRERLEPLGWPVVGSHEALAAALGVGRG